jgi:hypothetical protein
MVNKRSTGRFLGLPYDWRRPTRARLQARWWNPADSRVIVPKAFGWGYDVNPYQVAQRLRLVRRV